MNVIASPDKKSISGWGFTSYSLKVLALLLMTLDHIYYYLGGGILPVPHFFTLLGRISAPLFLFAMAEGFSHTHDRKAYLKRMYIASVLMSVGNDLINSYLPHPNGAMVINGMFATLFLVGLYIWAVELLIESVKEKNRKKTGAALTDPCIFQHCSHPVSGKCRRCFIYRKNGCPRIKHSDPLTNLCGRLCVLGGPWNRFLFSQG